MVASDGKVSLFDLRAARPAGSMTPFPRGVVCDFDVAGSLVACAGMRSQVRAAPPRSVPPAHHAHTSLTRSPPPPPRSSTRSASKTTSSTSSSA